MWIQTQNKQRIVNSDQVIDIYVDRAGLVIYASTTTKSEANKVLLGEYKDRDTCLKVLEHLSVGMGSNLPEIPMPLGGEVENWAEGLEEIAAINIVHKFVK